MIAIKVENISKQYRLGTVSTGTLSHDLNRWWHKVRRKEDPYLQIGVTNDRTVADKNEYVWALKDIDFEIKQGESVGIIGRNGAGKSTLLKILSQVTAPTTGNIKIKGRIAALLEVGTGFHPELTGRENIFLNGAILGMTKVEIRSKLDEIIDFAGVAKYVDTPVKRYSSGMLVRLGFAVAAHLEPEILIVDEVLAVGDTEFQKKCLGKMNDVNQKDGRTVLFVSHNMQAINKLCKKCILMSQGTLHSFDQTSTIIDTYLTLGAQLSNDRIWSFEEAPGIDYLKITRARLLNEEQVLKLNQDLHFEFVLQSQISIPINLSLVLRNNVGDVVFNVHSNVKQLHEGFSSSIIEIPANLLNDGRYFMDLYIVDANKIQSIFREEDILVFDLNDNRENTMWTGKWTGVIRPKLKFELS